MRRSLKISILYLAALAASGTAQTAGPSPAGRAGLERIARQIGRCGVERESGTSPDDSGVYYIGGPINVTWDITKVDSVRAPYQGFIEFSTPRKFLISSAGSSKHSAGYEGTMQQGAWTQKHRYEFDITDSGVELKKTLRFGQKDWIDEEPNAFCWQKAARNL